MMPCSNPGDQFQEVLLQMKLLRNSITFQTMTDEMVDQVRQQINELLESLHQMETTNGSEKLIIIKHEELRQELELRIFYVFQMLPCLFPLKETWDQYIKKIESAYQQCQQHHFITKHSLANLIKEMELYKVIKEESDEKALEAQQRVVEAEKKAEEAKKFAEDNAWQIRRAMEDMMAAIEETDSMKKAALQNENRLLQANKKMAKTEETLSTTELMLLDAQQKACEAKAKATIAEEKMVAITEATEARVKAAEEKVVLSEQRERELKKAFALVEKKVQIEEQKAREIVVEAEKVKEEMSKLKESASETVAKSYKQVTEMDDKVSKATLMMHAAQEKLSVAESKRALAEEKLKAAMERVEEVQCQLVALAERTAATEQSMDLGMSQAACTRSSKIRELHFQTKEEEKLVSFTVDHNEKIAQYNAGVQVETQTLARSAGPINNMDT
ncbi:tropomyosin beta chain-like [Latimeria chalumnae]|uniref:tropomyosin beta chain-like n=1 Tax=Latimeria chalumnae TaxID=7897 RepID=UPI00313AA696